MDRKRKRRASDSSPAGHTPIINNWIPVHAGQTVAGGSKRPTLDMTDSVSRPLCISTDASTESSALCLCQGAMSKLGYRKYILAFFGVWPNGVAVYGSIVGSDYLSGRVDFMEFAF